MRETKKNIISPVSCCRKKQANALVARRSSDTGQPIRINRRLWKTGKLFFQNLRGKLMLPIMRSAGPTCECLIFQLLVHMIVTILFKEFTYVRTATAFQSYAYLGMLFILQLFSLDNLDSLCLLHLIVLSFVHVSANQCWHFKISCYICILQTWHLLTRDFTKTQNLFQLH